MPRQSSKRHKNRSALRAVSLYEFSKAWGNLSDEDASPARVPAHRADEFRLAIPFTGCAPAVPASASPTVAEYAVASFCQSMLLGRMANLV